MSYELSGYRLRLAYESLSSRITELRRILAVFRSRFRVDFAAFFAWLSK